MASGPHVYGSVLGTRLDITNYDGAFQSVLELARSGRVALVAAANTHLVAQASSDPAFAVTLHSFDMVLPDGMPLVWALRLDGHAIPDRVYGPYFMEYVLKNSPPTTRHCFFGGTTECLDKLQQNVLKMNPGICIADAISPPFGKWDAATEANLIERINRAEADFVWVALGGVRQENWLAQHSDRFTRGVFLAVGDAFALVAGINSYAPAWMQRSGLTWLYRLTQEPGRLFSRYLRYNTKFVTALLADRICRIRG